MEVRLLSTLDHRITEFSSGIISRDFKHLDVAVGLYQSEKYNKIRITDGITCPACFVPRNDIEVMSKAFIELEEISSLSWSVPALLWFGGACLLKKDHDLRRIVAHELKHAEQWASVDQDVYDKDRLLDFIFSKRQVLAPSDIDANNFATPVVSGERGEEYKWIDKTNTLFEEWREKVERLYAKLIRGGFRTIHSQVFRHYYERLYKVA